MQESGNASLPLYEQSHHPIRAPPTASSTVPTARRPDHDPSDLALDLDDASWLWSIDDLNPSSAWHDPETASLLPSSHPKALPSDRPATHVPQSHLQLIPNHDPSAQALQQARRLALRQVRSPVSHAQIPASAGNVLWHPSLHDRSQLWLNASNGAHDMLPAHFESSSVRTAASMYVPHQEQHHHEQPLLPTGAAPIPWTIPSNSRQFTAPAEHTDQLQISSTPAPPQTSSGMMLVAHDQPPNPIMPRLETPLTDASISGVGPVRSRKRKRNGAKQPLPTQLEASPAAWKGRSGPLDETTREKSRSLRQYGACWRCRKYRKPCSNGPEMCETCVTSGFRVWPSELGCRRGNLDAYVDVFLPTNAEFVFQSSPLGINKRQPWRCLIDAKTLKVAQTAAALTTEDKRWSMLIHKALGTRIFGVEFVELFEIVANYQQTASREHPALDAACDMLNSTTDFYYTFVAIEGDETLMHDPIRTVRTIRKSFSRALRMILNGCLSGRANEWLPCLLASCMLAAAVVCFTDAARQIPPDVRQAIWTDVGAMVISIKGSLYGTVVHLLTALAKGGKPLQMSCWRVEEQTDASSGRTKCKRNENGMKLMAHDEPSFDGVRALQSWLLRHGSVITIGRVWSSSQPFSQAQIPAIAIMGALFDA